MAQTNVENEAGHPANRTHQIRRTHQAGTRWLKAIVAVLGVLVIALAIAAEYFAHHASPLLRESVVENLTARFHSPVQLDSLEVTLKHGVGVRGNGLRIYYLAGPSQPGLAQKDGQRPVPMLSVDSFSFRTTLSAILHHRIDLTRVDIDGLRLRIPPHSGGHIPFVSAPKTRIAISAAKIYCRNVTLIIENDKPDKAPLNFVIQSLQLTNAGTGQPTSFVADLVNPIPTGDIHTSGHFGPWRGNDPRGTPVDGQYTYTHVNLGTIKGISGTLTSAGQYEGHLSHIAVEGTTSTPNFALDISDHPLPLETTFHAFVDGTDGTTTLNPVEATLGQSHFTCRGTVANLRGKGHDIDLTVDMLHGRIQDMLQLGMKAEPPVMTGILSEQVKLHIPPGDRRVAQKMQLAGTLRIQGVEFGNPKLQDRVDALSMRAQGKPEDVKAVSSDGKPQVASQMAIDFSLANGAMTVNSLRYQVPGGQVNLDGVYSLNGDDYEFKGHLRTQATASQMVTGWKSILLTPFDSLFKKHGAGLELPISISGKGSDVHFGLAMEDANESPKQMKANLKKLPPSQPAPQH